MEATPPHIDAQEVASALATVDGVVGIHDLHIWTITSGFESLSVHARVRGRSRGDVLRELRKIVRERFGIEHSTVQLEDEDCGNGSCAG
jgi:cobalt-zinc-cadmium efflux system protein